MITLSCPCTDSLPYICVKLVAAAAAGGSGHDAQVVGIAEVFQEEEEEEDVPLVSQVEEIYDPVIVIFVVDEEDYNEMEWEACNHIWMEEEEWQYRKDHKHIIGW